MKIKVKPDFVACYNALVQISRINDSYPPKFASAMAHNIPIFQHMQGQILGREEELKDQVLDLPLVQFTIDSLPERVPKGSIEALKPLLLDYKELDFDFNKDVEEFFVNGQLEEEQENG